MKQFIKPILLILLLSLFGTNSASAAEVGILSYPLEASLTTESSSYDVNEVVRWEVNIAGGLTSGPNFDVHFTDSEGHSYWIRGLNKYSTSINIPYDNSGSVTGYISVHGAGQTVTDSKSIKIE
jgi:hypothetical protein